MRLLTSKHRLSMALGIVGKVLDEDGYKVTVSGQCCIKYFQKVFQLQITFLLKYFSYFCQLLRTK